MDSILLTGGGSNLPVITTRKRAEDPPLPWGDHYRTFGVHDFPDMNIWESDAGWVVHTTLMNEDPPFAQAFTHIKAGGGLIIRLNNGYGSTIPPNEANWQGFASEAAGYMYRLYDYVKRQLPNGHPATIVAIIGNEQNASGEWGGGAGYEITPERYAKCFNQCYQTIKARVPGVLVAPGAIAWYGFSPLREGNLHPRDYFLRMVTAIADMDAIILHTYSHTNDPASCSWDVRFRDGLPDLCYDFRNYRNQMEAIPEKWRFLPVHITETNPGAELTQNPAWKDENRGWIVSAYRDIADWNAQTHNQQIHSLSLFCWTNRVVDRQEYGIKGKLNVIADFKRAQREVDGRRFVPNWLPPYVNYSYSSQNAVGAMKYSADCGHACIRMWLDEANVAKGVTIDQLADLVRQSSAGYSSAYDLIKLAGLYGIAANYFYDGQPDLGDICLIRYSELPTRMDKGFTGLHWFIYIGQKDLNVIVHDPDYLGNGGRFKEYPKVDFERAFTGLVVRRIK